MFRPEAAREGGCTIKMLPGGWKVKESGTGWNRTESSLSQEVARSGKGCRHQALGICSQCKIWNLENGGNSCEADFSKGILAKDYWQSRHGLPEYLEGIVVRMHR
jgi:hypothetical protein